MPDMSDFRTAENKYWFQSMLNQVDPESFCPSFTVILYPNPKNASGVGQRMLVRGIHAQGVGDFAKNGDHGLPGVSVSVTSRCICLSDRLLGRLFQTSGSHHGIPDPAPAPLHTAAA